MAKQRWSQFSPVPKCHLDQPERFCSAEQKAVLGARLCVFPAWPPRRNLGSKVLPFRSSTVAPTMSHFTALPTFDLSVGGVSDWFGDAPTQQSPGSPWDHREMWPPTIEGFAQGHWPSPRCCLRASGSNSSPPRKIIPNRWRNLKLSTKRSRSTSENITLRWPSSAVWCPPRTHTSTCGLPGQVDTNIHQEHQNKTLGENPPS